MSLYGFEWGGFRSRLSGYGLVEGSPRQIDQRESLLFPLPIFVTCFDDQLDRCIIRMEFHRDFRIFKVDFVAAAITAANNYVRHLSNLPSKPAYPTNDINLFGGPFILRVMLIVRDHADGRWIAVGDVL